MKTSELFLLNPDAFGAPDKHSNVRLALFRGVENAAELQRMLTEGKLDASLIKAELIIERFQVLAAANRAVHCLNTGQLVTRNIHAEIVFSLSPSRNISDSLSTFGIGADTANVLVAVYDDAKGKKMAAVARKIDGRPVCLDQLQNIHDYQLIKTVYHVRDPELNKSPITDSIVSRIISKDFAA